MGMLEDFELLQNSGFTLLPYAVARDEEEAVVCADRIGYPLAMKIISPDIIHKTDVGGVKVDIKSEAALRIAYNEIIEATKKKKIEGVLLQKMARRGIELIIGGKKDPQFGHMIILGLGGVYVEIFRDIAARICPITEKDVEEMVEELKSHPILEGARGQKPINLAKLKDLMLKTCAFIQKNNIEEMDLNPVVFDEKGYDIIDVRFSFAKD